MNATINGAENQNLNAEVVMENCEINGTDAEAGMVSEKTEEILVLQTPLI